MRDAEAGLGVFRDPEEFQYYKNMFHNLTDIMTEVGFSDEVTSLVFTFVIISCKLSGWFSGYFTGVSPWPRVLFPVLTREMVGDHQAG